MARVGDGRVEGMKRAGPLGDCPEPQGSRVGGEPSAPEVGDLDPRVENGSVVRLPSVIAVALLAVGDGSVLTHTR
jgi:hypothetical protein